MELDSQEVGSSTDGWVCHHGDAGETLNPEEAPRCSVCDEPRAKRRQINNSSGVPVSSHSLSREVSNASRNYGSCSQSISRDNSDASDAMGVHDEDANRSRIDEDILEANTKFGPESAKVKQGAIGGVWLYLSFRPFEKGRPESLPAEVCRAWGLSKRFGDNEEFLSKEFGLPAVLVLSIEKDNAVYQRGWACSLSIGSCLGRYLLVAGCEMNAGPAWKHETNDRCIAKNCDGCWSLQLWSSKSPLFSPVCLHDDNAMYPHQSSAAWKEYNDLKQWVELDLLKCCAEAEIIGAEPIEVEPIEAEPIDAKSETTSKSPFELSPLTLKLTFEDAAAYNQMRIVETKLFFENCPQTFDASDVGCNVAVRTYTNTHTITKSVREREREKGGEGRPGNVFCP